MEQSEVRDSGEDSSGRVWGRLGRFVGVSLIVVLAIGLLAGAFLWFESRSDGRAADALRRASVERGEPATFEALMLATPVVERARPFNTFRLQLEAAGEQVPFDLDRALEEIAGWEEPHDSWASDLGIDSAPESEVQFDRQPPMELLERAVAAVDPDSETYPRNQLDELVESSFEAGSIPAVGSPEHAWTQLRIAEAEAVLDVLETLPTVGDRDRSSEIEAAAGPIQLLLDMPLALFELSSATRVLELGLRRAVIEGDASAAATLDSSLEILTTLDDRLGTPMSIFDLYADVIVAKGTLDLLELATSVLEPDEGRARLLAEGRAWLQLQDPASDLRSAVIGERLALDDFYGRMMAGDADLYAWMLEDSETEFSEAPGSRSWLGFLSRLVLEVQRARLWGSTEDLLERLDRAGLERFEPDGLGGFHFEEPEGYLERLGAVFEPQWESVIEQVVSIERERRRALCGLTGIIDGPDALTDALDQWRDPDSGAAFEVVLDEHGRRVLSGRSDVGRTRVWVLERADVGQE
ncbi:MAG: hypothetical protein ACYSWX_01175 [Planctomycetota bacterium]|jgi:hypothetical protein